MIQPELQRPKGTRDVLPPESWRVERMRRLAVDTATRYGFEPIETPILEQTPVFLRVGESTDIVLHERYRFTDAGGDDLTLRPEGTAAVARAYVENGLYNAPQPLRLFYWGPMFRREKPQAERYRQHTQFGAEVYGSPQPAADADVMLLATAVVEGVGLHHPVIRVNSIGCAVCRPRYRQALLGYYGDRRADLCPDCQERLERNPLRVLDCKVDVAIRQEAPDIADFWCDECRRHLQEVTELVKEAGGDIRRDAHLVRGLDYYTRTVFEVGHPQFGDGVALFGGGRYDGLAQGYGGPAAPAVGFGMGIERILSAVRDTFLAVPVDRLYIAHLPGFQKPAFLLAERLRRQGFNAEGDLVGRSLKAQLKEAARRARIVLIVGGEEWDNGFIVARNLQTGTQDTVPREKLDEYLVSKR